VRSAFITGAASGIGRATARRFAAGGFRIGAADIDIPGLETLRAELGAGRCETYRLDVGDKAAFDAAIAAFGSVTGGTLDVLFNNAGIAATGFFEDIPFERTLEMVRINVVGVLNGIHAALPLLKRTPNALCCSTASSAATYGPAGLAVYGATKFAVKGLTEALAVEFARFGVRAADLLPGIIDTPILHATRYVDTRPVPVEGRTIGASPPREGAFRMLPPEVVADAAWEAWTGNRMHHYVPPEIEDIEREKVKSPDAMRDARIARARDAAAARAPGI
jgi:NAD(P)-dependent dehydrogenase (short-subunit alcohol dehydrogenase family)